MTIVKLTQFTRLLYRQSNNGSYQIRRTYSDKILPASDYFTWNTANPVKLHIGKEDTLTGNIIDSAPENYPPILVQSMMKKVVEENRDRRAIVSCDGTIDWNYGQYYQEVQKAAKGFISLGLTPQHGVGIMAHNHPNWFVSSLASIFAGGLSCGIYTTNSPATVKYICEHAPLDLLILQNTQMLELMLKTEPDIEKIVKSFVLMEDVKSSGNIISWNEMLDRGNNVDDKVLAEKEKEQAVNQACMLIYTSGTTGPPKGAMLSHDNVTWSSRMAIEHYNWNQERLLSYLPLSHVAACLIDCYMSMYAATEIHFADQEALKGTLVENLKRVRPTRFLGVPRVWEKIAEKMQEVGRSSKGVKKALATWAKKSATNYHTLVRSGALTPDQIKRSDQYFQYWLAKKLILSRIHEALGLENATLMPESTCSSAAPLNVETFMYFQSLDIVIYELLGCTESVAQTTNMAGPLCKPGSAGQAYVGVHNTILNPDENGIGEIATKSRNVFMGYHRDEVKTKEAFEDGWFKSGDLGKLDEDQFLWMCGRLKELIITAGGENIAPLPIENNILAELSDILSYVIVIGDTRKYLSCLITLKCKVDQESGLATNELEDKAVKWCNSVAPGSNPVTIQDFKRKKLLQKAIQKGLERANEIATANPCKVQKFTILPEELSVQGGELGPTLKLKRHAITTKYQNLIDEMYAD